MKLNKMPNVALGTWEVTDPSDINKVIPAALQNGYKHIDTAQLYFNEEFIGEALSKLDIPREEYWITTKVFPNNFRYHTTKSVEESLKRLQTEYVDTVLLHAMAEEEDVIKAYKELMALRDKGLVRTVGVSNFSIEMLNVVKEATGEYPAYNQIINSVKHRMIKLETFSKENGIELMGYSAIRPYYNPNTFYPSSGLSNEEKKVIDDLASKYGATPAHILSRWSMQHGYIILPKSKNPERVIENFKVNDFVINEEDMKTLDAMNSFGDEEFKMTMEAWKSNTHLPDEVLKVGVRISPESDKAFLEGRFSSPE